MLGFILSKLNLLIMVTAIFAILTYFTFFVGQSVELRESQAILNNLVEETYGVLSSTGQCHQTVATIPRYIHSVGTGEFNNRLRFFVEISKTQAPGSAKTTISYSILARKPGQEPVRLAARPFSTDADVQLWAWDSTKGATPILKTDPTILVNPNSVVPTDSLLLIKEVYLDHITLYIITCSSDTGDWCKKNFEDLKTHVDASRSNCGTECFNCATPPF